MESFAKSSTGEIATLGNQFDHRPAMPTRASEIRHRVDPGDVPPEKAARRLHLSLRRFEEVLPDLLIRGFPAADPTTGMYDLEAIDLWRKSRHQPESSLTTRPVARNAKDVIRARLAGTRNG
jgi:hypothetical protein